MAQQVRKWVVELTAEQREELERVVRSQKASALIAKRARILLLADAVHPEGRRTDESIGETVGMTRRQVQRPGGRVACPQLWVGISWMMICCLWFP